MLKNKQREIRQQLASRNPWAKGKAKVASDHRKRRMASSFNPTLALVKRQPGETNLSDLEFQLERMTRG